VTACIPPAAGSALPTALQTKKGYNWCILFCGEYRIPRYRDEVSGEPVTACIPPAAGKRPSQLHYKRKKDTTGVSFSVEASGDFSNLKMEDLRLIESFMALSY
jgi:hypothetical protein